MSEESIMADLSERAANPTESGDGVFYYYGHELCVNEDELKKWLRSALRSYALHVVEAGRPEEWSIHGMDISPNVMLARNQTIDEYSSRMRELIG